MAQPRTQTELHPGLVVGCPAQFPPTGAVWKMLGRMIVKVAILLHA